jgi:hypothetical protein
MRQESHDRCQTHCGPDTSASGRDWGWVMGALQAGLDTEFVYRQLLARARPRRGADAERYARRTLQQALRQLERFSPPHRRGA